MHNIYLTIAIIGEVIATSALKATNGFTNFWPSLITIFGYSCAFYFLTLSLKVIPVGVAYAIWSGVGIVLIAIISMLLYKQIPDLPAVLGMTMIIGGVVIIQLFSSTVSH